MANKDIGSAVCTGLDVKERYRDWNLAPLINQAYAELLEIFGFVCVRKHQLTCLDRVRWLRRLALAGLVLRRHPELIVDVLLEVLRGHRVFVFRDPCGQRQLRPPVGVRALHLDEEFGGVALGNRARDGQVQVRCTLWSRGLPAFGEIDAFTLVGFWGGPGGDDINGVLLGCHPQISKIYQTWLVGSNGSRL